VAPPVDSEVPGAAEPERLLARRYRLEAVIGRGGMGAVWRARDELLNRDVAVKEIIWPPYLDKAEQETARRRAMREAQMAARLSHPNVVGIYDIVEEDGRPWIVMELVPYPSLRDVVREDGPLSPGQAAEVGLGILAALRAAHDAGVLHRDVKPGNVLLGPGGRVVLTDFGIARADGSPALTTSGVLVGSPSYLSPERARGGQAGTAGDLWALGASLYAAVEGRPPFGREGVLASLTAVVTDEPDPSTRTGPLQPVISGLLRKDPGTRLGAEEVEQMLRRVAEGEGPTAEQPAVGEPEAPAGHRQSGTAALAAPVPDPEPAAGPGAGGVLAPERPWPDDSAGPPKPEPPEPEPESQAPESRAPEAAQQAPGPEPAGPQPVSQPAGPGADSPTTGPMPPAPAPGSARPGRRRSRVLLGAAASAAVIAVIAVIAVAIALTSNSPARRPASAPPASHPAPTTPATRPASSAPASSSAPAGPSAGAPGSGTGRLPAGYYRFTNSTGFSIGVPAGWQISHAGHYVYIQDPSSPGVFLLIDQSDTPKPNPLADWQQQAANREGTYQDYHLIRLQSVRYPQAEKAADWEFTYARNGQAVRVLNRNVLANPDHAYALYWTTPDSAWNADYHFFQVFAATFRPAGVNQTG
jgi:tRNA A-37 threonylcarbamoyl transferase component Bud32